MVKMPRKKISPKHITMTDKVCIIGKKKAKKVFEKIFDSPAPPNLHFLRLSISQRGTPLLDAMSSEGSPYPKDDIEAEKGIIDGLEVRHSEDVGWLMKKADFCK